MSLRLIDLERKNWHNCLLELLCYVKDSPWIGLGFMEESFEVHFFKNLKVLLELIHHLASKLS